MKDLKFSIIIPVYNRPDEVEELLASLESQTVKNFEVIIIEDGSTVPCEEVVKRFHDKLDIKYFTKSNSGRSYTRNYGMEQAGGNYFIFFDSDCIIPPHYFEALTRNLQNEYSDCFGGPDNAHESFSDVQKAINYSMTSFFTTGGIRGGKKQMEKFKPRTFNMGFSRTVYETVGDFKNMFGEDIDLAMRIENAGFKIVLFNDVFVYHKRRVSLKKFFKQTRIFGTARVNLSLIHKGALKVVHTLPAWFFIGNIVLMIVGCFYPYFFLPMGLYVLLIFFDALGKTKNVKIAFLAIITSYIQLVSYGMGFLESFWKKRILKRGLENEKVLLKKYK